MLRTLLAPRWLAVHALTVAAVAGMLWLGQWQYDEAEAGRERDARQSAAPVPLDEVTEPGVPLPGGVVDRRVVLAGSWTGEPATVPGRVRAETMGAYVLGLVQLADGGSVVVLRGWVPDGTHVSRPSGPVSVTGTLRPYETEADATLSEGADLNPGELRFVGTPAVQAMGARGGAAYDGFVVLERQEPAAAADAPEPVPLDEVAPQSGVGVWQHVSYWAQWWVFAAAAVVFWALLVRAAVRGRRQTA